jgi:hypothetical protein
MDEIVNEVIRLLRYHVWGFYHLNYQTIKIVVLDNTVNEVIRLLKHGSLCHSLFFPMEGITIKKYWAKLSDNSQQGRFLHFYWLKLTVDKRLYFML